MSFINNTVDFVNICSKLKAYLKKKITLIFREKRFQKSYGRERKLEF